MRRIEQQIRFCTSSDDVRLAYATVGSGPPLVKAANWLSHLEFDWNSPVWRHWIRELSRDHTFIRYDERGCGLSDWGAQEYSLEAWVRDLEAVVDALRLERFPLLGISQGGPIAIAYAARHPERVSHLVLWGSYSRGRSHRQRSEREREEREMMISMIKVGWGEDHPAFRQVFTSLFIPDGTPEQVHWFNELERVSTSPDNAARIARTFDELDVRHLAPTLNVPTLVLHATNELRVPFEEGRLLASLIPGARFVPLESRNHVLLENEPAWPRFQHELRSFLGVAQEEAPAPGRARRQEIDALLDQALELAPDERPALLARIGADDPELRREVESLLSYAEQSGITAKLAAAVATPKPRPASRLALAPGQAVSQYELVERLGSGGMGVVYKAVDRRLKRFVALKFLPPSLGEEQELKLRFMQEAKAIAFLDHPNLCTIHEVEEWENGQLFIVMPYYEGVTLRQKIAAGPLPFAEVWDYGAQIARGLAHAHDAGVVHRDIKPANIVVTAGGRVKILDFGIAKLRDTSLTQAGAVLGTLSYMSPEQSCGESVDHRTDLWALGVVLYEMLTGRPPFAAETREGLFYAIAYRDPVRMDALRPGVPAALDEIVSRLLEKQPGARYDDARAVAAALEEGRS
jgi:pimeloyl-ACP methyl ester carboxylesterase